MSDYSTTLFMETPTGRSRLYIVKERRDAAWWRVYGIRGVFLARITTEPRRRLGIPPDRTLTRSTELCINLCFDDDCGADTSFGPGVAIMPAAWDVKVVAGNVDFVDYFEMRWRVRPDGNHYTSEVPCPPEYAEDWDRLETLGLRMPARPLRPGPESSKRAPGADR